MNVCLVAYTFYEVDTRVRMYAQALMERANRLDVIALRREGEKRNGVLNGINICRIQRRNYNERGLLSYILKIGMFFIMGSIVLLFKQLRYRYQVVHIHNVPDFLVFMGFLPKLMGAKVILDIHDILPEFYCQKFGKTLDSALAKLLLFLEKISVRFADQVIVANDLWKEKIINRDGIPARACTTILNYPSISFYGNSLSLSKKKPYTIIYPGTLSHHHGLDIAIKALPIVKKEIPRVRLHIYIRSNNLEYYRYLKRLIQSLRLGQNVHFFEPVPITQLGDLYQSSSLGIVPKRGGVFSDEAFSTKIFEFMAVGLPIIASRTKIDEYYFDDSMIMFFEPENPEDLARCIIELYNNPNKAESLANKARQFVAKNNWETKRRIYLDLIDSLTARKWPRD